MSQVYKLLLCTLMFAVAAFGSDYREAIIVRVHLLRAGADSSMGRDSTATLNSNDTYEITLRLGNVVYTSIYQPRWKWSFKASELEEGSRIQMRIEGDKLFFKLRNGKELKTSIVSEQSAAVE